MAHLGEDTSAGLASSLGSSSSSRQARNSSTKALDLSPQVKKNWKKVLKRLTTVTFPKRIMDAAAKTAGALCNECDIMKLTEAKFIILDFEKHRRTVRNNKRPYSAVSGEDSLGSEGLEFGPKEFRLGALCDIKMKHGSCVFCSLIIKSLKDVLDAYLREGSGRTEKAFYEQDAAVSVSWQIDGRILSRDPDNTINGSRPCTRRLRLRWSRSDWPDSFVVLMEMKNTTQSLFLARSTTTLRIDAALIGRWLRFCDESHQDKYSPISPNVLESKPFLGVIDVKDMCLTKLPKGARYVALSYTWGKEGPWQFKTKRENVKSLMASGGLNEWRDTMPRTIRDSIQLVINLGERYLWVDALCIIQDSPRSWALNSNVMNIVYGNAYFTICAADGDNANIGLKALDAPEAKQNIAMYSKDIRLKCLQPAEHYIRKSAWNTRGWTFQERLLSPRTLIFVSGRMFFQCRCTARSVDIITEDEKAGWSTEFTLSPSLMLRKLPFQPLLVYKEALALYMRRKLSFPKDILAAFTGIGNLVCETLGGSLMFGLPSSHFDWALLWEFKSAASRRSQEEEELFPSWSWCGWKNQVMDCEYKSQILAGIEDNLHDWLMNHTWITWYIRDGNGNLRPVWDGNTGKMPGKMVDTTWKGYTLPTEPTLTAHDTYGRRIRASEQERLIDREFTLILDECPFAVEIVHETGGHAPNSAAKDMPFLQFYTWSAHFRIREERRTQVVPHAGRDTDSNLLLRYSIFDYKDDWCGTIMLDSVWVVKNAIDIDDDPMEFMAISDAKQFDREEYDDWANYIPMERRESTWDLYYVLLIERKADIAYRVGLGKVYKEAFENSCKPEGKRWKEFILG
ncbi:HET-domain-containing protein [Plenodomus tracheiphilus IPT5]|uniref:HET-domain-containing protein n=1 Tax=Plenodomus tracheiphilus IPT5 TaxID=1408161 RepID=A0A6A7AY32_9PLEO|nr:HET-domain-containing protein [Plenodomus tracheiphilus IPT5]